MQPVRRVGPKSTVQRRVSHLRTAQQVRERTPSRKRGQALRKRSREAEDDLDEEEIEPTRKRPRQSVGRNASIHDDDDSDYAP